MAFSGAGLLARFTRPGPAAPPEADLYRAVVAAARDPGWYTAGEVPDTIDGRFDMVALVQSLVLLRLEDGGEAETRLAVGLTERFVADMDGTLREIGIGDLVVGKHVGKLMGALGGRLGAYRLALRGESGALPEPGALESALVRNLYRGRDPGPEALGWTAARARAFLAALDATGFPVIAAARLPGL